MGWYAANERADIVVGGKKSIPCAVVRGREATVDEWMAEYAGGRAGHVTAGKDGAKAE